ncbi:MAG: hypothetical protein R3F34_05170 [Planctomycetota bacterium]
MTTPNRTAILAALATALVAGRFATTATAQVIVEDERLVEAGLALGDRYGQSVATSGGRVAVGAPMHAYNGSQSGLAWVYTRDPGGTLVLEDELVSFGLAPNDEFGTSVAIDGERAVVGAPYVDTLTINEGAAFVFERQPNGSWLQVAVLQAGDGTTGDRFGATVAIDGDTIVVGAPDDDPSGLSSAGSAYVFERDGGGNWNEAAKLVSPSSGATRRFGAHLDLDGDTIAVGQNLKASESGQPQVFLFARNGGAWPLEDSLASPDRSTPGSNLFCSDLDLDGDRLLVGDPATTAGGRALLYERQGANWIGVDVIAASALISKAPVGTTVALCGDTAVLGGPGSAQKEGRAAIFLESSFGGWRELASIEPDIRSGIAPDEYALDLAMDDATIVAGAPRLTPVETGIRTGATFVLRRGRLLHGHKKLAVAGGGQQDFLLLAGTTYKQHFHWIVGSASGTTPGTVISPTLTVPLNVDSYALQTLSLTNSPTIPVSFGILDPDGVSQRLLNVPFGLNPALAGLTLNHAYLIFAPGSFALVDVSNAVPMTLVP